ncbi:hypothetical protein BV898_12890 [Hypsibius exemplaris]|uniref:Receptor ligand binding region domain-containing protein n=1 Tax=Hypsibius exemplaris TaxID=2072580 RepID=A0A1W0WCF9_HYPEX|nr:hypothetical protein BV898_12890 [Hypsibius exemplaris]
MLSNVFATEDFWGPVPGTKREDIAVVAMGATHMGIARAILDILAARGWFHVTVLAEMRPNMIWYRDTGLALLSQARLAPPQEPFVMQSFTMEVITDDVVKAFLLAAEQTSRVIIISGVASTALSVLTLANSMGAGNGEFVFLSVQSLEKESENYGTTAQFTRKENNPQEENLNPFRSFFFIVYRPAGTELQSLNDQLTERTRIFYNTTYEAGTQPLDNFAVKSSYDIVETFAAVVNESRGDPTAAHACHGQSLVRAMAKRTFTISSGTVRITADRAHEFDLNIFGFNSSTKQMQVVGMFDWTAGKWKWRADRSTDWPTHDRQPPLDVPLCGFSGADGPCSTKSTALKTAVPVIMALLVGVYALAKWHVKPAEDWWCVEVGPKPKLYFSPGHALSTVAVRKWPSTADFAKMLANRYQTLAC